jgi:hypothetical protein
MMVATTRTATAAARARPAVPAPAAAPPAEGNDSAAEPPLPGGGAGRLLRGCRVLVGHPLRVAASGLALAVVVAAVLLAEAVQAVLAFLLDVLVPRMQAAGMLAVAGSGEDGAAGETRWWAFTKGASASPSQH